MGRRPVRGRRDRLPHVGDDALLDPEFDDTDIAELTRRLVPGPDAAKVGEDGDEASGTGWPAPEEEATWQDADDPD